jgi:hypothetical protein
LLAQKNRLKILALDFFKKEAHSAACTMKEKMLEGDRINGFLKPFFLSFKAFGEALLRRA